MSRLTRTGLWLVPWLPLLVVAMTVAFSYDRSLDPCPVGPPQEANSVPTACVILVYTTKVFTAAFFMGLVLLAIAYARRLISSKS